MDYDDNDFQSQNHHLAGEGSSKFSTVLHSYVLPKFDFDDSLQGNLRFDSSVENEVFLGIQSQEDSQWIEEFSQASNGLELGSSAAESCAFSRRHNVWSEAASSESVEMLLKSVGHDERVPVEPIIVKSVEIDEECTLIKQMEPCSEQVGERDHFSSSQHASPVDEIFENLPGLEGGAEAEHVNDTGASISQKFEHAGSEFESNAVPDKTSLVDEEGIDTQCDVISQEEVDELVNVSSENHMREALSASCVQGENAECCKNVHFDAEESTVSEKAVELRGLCNDNENVLPKGTVIELNLQCRHSNNEERPKALSSDEHVRVCAIPAGIIEEEVADCAELRISSTSQTTAVQGCSLEEKGNALGSYTQQDRGNSNVSSDPSMLSLVPCELPRQGDGSIKCEDDVANMAEKCSSSVVVSLETKTDDNNDGNKDFDVPKEVLNSDDHVSSTVASDSTLIGEELPPTDSVDVQMVCEVVETLGNRMKVRSSSFCELNEGDDVIAHGSTLIEAGNGASTIIEHVVQPSLPAVAVVIPKDDSKQDIEMEVRKETETIERIEEVLIALDLVSEGPVSQTKKDMSHDCVAQVVHEVTSAQGVGKREASSCEQASVADEVGQEFSKLEGSPVICDLSAKEVDDTEVVSIENPEESAVERNQKMEHLMCPVNVSNDHEASVDVCRPSECDANQMFRGGSHSPILEKPGCDSSPVVNSVELSDDVKGKEEGILGVMLKNFPPLDVINDPERKIRSMSQNVRKISKGDKSFNCEIVEGSSLKSEGEKADPKMTKEASQGSHLTSTGGITEVGSTGNSEHKTRRKTAGKETAKKGKHINEIAPLKHSGISLPGTGQVLQSLELKASDKVEFSGTKPVDFISVPASNLPDLNTAVPFSKQPFTDMQQVQLRAQIFVYGSLIQGTAPDEACMIAAFGQSDDAKISWEPAWRTCLGRLQGHKSLANNFDTPVQSRSGSKAPNQASKHTPRQSKVTSSTVHADKRGTPAQVVSSIVPLSSPLWNISTPSRDASQSAQWLASPSHPYQTPPVQSFIGHNTSWIPHSSFHGQWVTSPPPSGFSGRISALPMTEAVKLTPITEPGSTSAKHGSLVPVVQSGGPATSGVSKGRKRKKVTDTLGFDQISFPPQTKAAIASGPVFVDHLSKRVHGSDAHVQIPLFVQSQAQSLSTAVASGFFSTTESVLTPSVTLKSSPGGNTVSWNDHHRSGDNNNDVVTVTLWEETINKVEEAKKQAEVASQDAAAAIIHCRDMWSHLERQKDVGLGLNVEAKLTSAAAAIAAAASVAKAAAAAAKIAADSAEAARLMADEVLVSSGTSVANGAMNFGIDVDGSSISGSIIASAREAARKKIEAASAASKHALNLDAIVKAAELAAEAVSQAGKVVAMGDPLPLRKLVEFGPEGYWKTPQIASEHHHHITSGKVNGHESNSKSLEPAPVDSDRPGASDEIQALNHGITVGEASRGPKARRTSESSKTIGVIPESEIGFSRASSSGHNECKDTATASSDNSLKEGCLIEVFKDGGACKAAWFPARVLNMKDGKVFVSYIELKSDDGSEQLKEWVLIEDGDRNEPRVRIAHPSTALQFEGKRKRRRAAMTEYLWSVGDRVDVWIRNCWREGVVTEKNKEDETKLTVHFPALGETSVVRVWHARPTLVWKDGEWIDSSITKGDKSSNVYGDTPQEKRLKLSSPFVDAHGTDKISKAIALDESGKHGDSKLLPLSDAEQQFNVGKNAKEEKRLDAHRKVRSGLQKNPRVIIGVPKPGKKQKFMDVSKHYDTNRTNKICNMPNEPLKLARYLVPQWKNNSKNVPKERRVVETKPREFKSRRPPKTTHTLENHSIGNNESDSDHKKLEVGSSSNPENFTACPAVDSFLAPPNVSKKVTSSNPNSERLNLAKPEVKDKLISEGEPRRSNRRIQPTSRLLEGLQSSLTISKIAATSHARNQKSQSRVPLKGNNKHS